MNYLVIEGYKDAAEKFKEETRLDTEIDMMSIEDRMRIRFSIQNGHIQDAIKRINDIDPEVAIVVCGSYETNYFATLFHRRRIYLLPLSIALGNRATALFPLTTAAPHRTNPSRPY